VGEDVYRWCEVSEISMRGWGSNQRGVVEL